MFDKEKEELTMSARTVDMFDIDRLETKLASRDVKMHDRQLLIHRLASRVVTMTDTQTSDYSDACRNAHMHDTEKEAQEAAGRTVRMHDLHKVEREAAARTIEMENMGGMIQLEGAEMILCPATGHRHTQTVQKKRKAVLSQDMYKKWRISFTEQYTITRDSQDTTIITSLDTPQSPTRYTQPWDRDTLRGRRQLEGSNRAEILRQAWCTISHHSNTTSIDLQAGSQENRENLCLTSIVQFPNYSGCQANNTSKESQQPNVLSYEAGINSNFNYTYESADYLNGRGLQTRSDKESGGGFGNNGPADKINCNSSV